MVPLLLHGRLMAQSDGANCEVVEGQSHYVFSSAWVLGSKGDASQGKLTSFGGKKDLSKFFGKSLMSMSLPALERSS